MSPSRKRSKDTEIADELASLPFEAAMDELEEVVQRLDAGDVALEDSLEAFERGVRLVKLLHRRLDSVERRIEELAIDDDTEPSDSDDDN
jgi:exodeoxyribonuclease VII small subunit